MRGLSTLGCIAKVFLFMSRIAPNFGRTVYEPASENVPDNIQGLRRGGAALLILSIGICVVYLPAGIVGIVSALLWMAASKLAAVTTRAMETALENGDKTAGCGWYVATLLIGMVVFALVLMLAGAAMTGQ